MKAIYHILNQFSLRDAQRVLIGDCWMPTADIPAIKSAITTGAQNAGTSVVPTIERIPTKEEHPTFNRTNKYTSGFQVESVMLSGLAGYEWTRERKESVLFH